MNNETMIENDYFRQALVHIVNERGRGVQNTLSIDTGLSDAYISQVIAGKRAPSMNVQSKIVNALGIDYLDFLALGKKITEVNLQKTSLSEIARQREGRPRKSADPAAAGGLPEMLFASMKSQIDMLNDAIKEMRSERVVLVDALKADLERCQDTLSGQELHIHRLNETLDKVNADMRQMQDRMIEAARSGDIHHLEKISGAG
jgi:transcriptional regulator with XRE-family HTH domain